MKRTPRKPSVSGFSVDRESLAEWAKDKPLSILQLDPADRAVLRIAVSNSVRVNTVDRHPSGSVGTNCNDINKRCPPFEVQRSIIVETCRRTSAPPPPSKNTDTSRL
ncbi:hypothetical protein ZHAS_00015665 [Anopheles sinensis]|uniref:Uncharacterized protein n=1 Tax=Anopheles sinensis TaxID=74873 RepID=A0A084WB22_ANOSI|nr:hypothetical protein ZHAS_00015665 [Anopheles sinensis]